MRYCLVIFAAFMTFAEERGCNLGDATQMPEVALSDFRVDVLLIPAPDIIIMRATYPLPSSPRQFVRSRDGGSTWDSVNASFEAIAGKFLSPQDFAIGKDGSIWVLWSELLPSGQDGNRKWSSGLAVSHDFGTSFSSVDFTEFQFAWFIPVPNENPLVMESWGSQLWSLDEGKGLSKDTVRPWGNPVPLGRPGLGVACKSAIYFLGGGIYDWSFWRSEDEGQSWEEQLALFGGPGYIMCSRAEALWALLGETAYRFDPQESRWKGVEFLSGVETRSGAVNGFAAHGEDLFVSARSCTGEITIQRIEPDRDITRDITHVDGSNRGEPVAARLLVEDPAGRLWAAGSGLFLYDDTRKGFLQVWP